ncbi:helix-turn-helix domain-containing protein [Acidiplasma sp.]|uniref:helix-turn-helix domain-containing protein n=1 Tax=Acidiplasma sp. TaxID=1872114 RepID=UPI00258C6C24|nr:helix-turn-helix domain-containing protein [Acidiplasma sp.]
MYLINVKTKSSCSLSESTYNNDSKIILSYVGKTGKYFNSIFGYFAVNDDFKEKYHKDFNKIKFTAGKDFIAFSGNKRGHGIMNAIAENDAMPIFPFFSFTGLEHYFIVTYDKNSIEGIFNSISKSHNKIIEYDYVNLKSGDGILDISKKIYSMVHTLKITALERKLIKEALQNGYYEWPRTYSLQNIADEYGLSKPTVLFHIRNAEKKIIESILD